MTDPGSRRNFLLGRFSRPKAPLRPPWALAENDFLQACTRCADCVQACPTHIIIGREADYPTIDFAEGECTFCGHCVTACQSGALRRAEGQLPWKVRALIGEHCLARQGVECRVCGEQCAAGAIRFALQAGGVALPEIDASRCTGCGACVGTCPTRAISVG